MNAESAAAILERRSDPRYAVSIMVEILDSNLGQFCCDAVDLSRTGAFLKPSNTGIALPPIGSRVRLVLKWPIETKTPPIEVVAEVTRQTPDGIGVRFHL